MTFSSPTDQTQAPGHAPDPEAAAAVPAPEAEEVPAEAGADAPDAQAIDAGGPEAEAPEAGEPEAVAAEAVQAEAVEVEAPETEAIDTEAAVTLDKVNDAWTITAIHLMTRARVPNIDAPKFAEIAGGAKANCPVSRVLNATITMDAKLVG